MMEQTTLIDLEKIRGLQSPAKDIDGFIKGISTVSDFATIEGKPKKIHVSGYHSKDDGAYGSNFFILKDGVVPNGSHGNSGTVWESPEGVYELQFEGAVKPEWFGLVVDNSSFSLSNTQAWQSANDWAKSVSKTIILPSGNIYTGDTVYVSVTTLGMGKNDTMIIPNFDGEIVSTPFYDFYGRYVTDLDMPNKSVIFLKKEQYLDIGKFRIFGGSVFSDSALGNIKNLTGINTDKTNKITRGYMHDISLYGLGIGMYAIGWVTDFKNILINGCSLGAFGHQLNNVTFEVKAENCIQAYKFYECGQLEIISALDEGSVSSVASEIDKCADMTIHGIYGEPHKGEYTFKIGTLEPKAEAGFSDDKDFECRNINITDYHMSFRADFAGSFVHLLLDNVNGVNIKGSNNNVYQKMYEKTVRARNIKTDIISYDYRVNNINDKVVNNLMFDPTMKGKLSGFEVTGLVNEFSLDFVDKVDGISALTDNIMAKLSIKDNSNNDTMNFNLRDYGWSNYIKEGDKLHLFLKIYVPKQTYTERTPSDLPLFRLKVNGKTNNLESFYASTMLDDWTLIEMSQVVGADPVTSLSLVVYLRDKPAGTYILIDSMHLCTNVQDKSTIENGTISSYSPIANVDEEGNTIFNVIEPSDGWLRYKKGDKFKQDMSIDGKLPYTVCVRDGDRPSNSLGLWKPTGLPDVIPDLRQDDKKAWNNNGVLMLGGNGPVVYNFKNISQMETFIAKGTVKDNDVLTVSEKGRGGTFIFDSSKASENDGGMIFNGAVRQVNDEMKTKWFNIEDNVTFYKPNLLDIITGKGLHSFTDEVMMCERYILSRQTNTQIIRNISIDGGSKSNYAILIEATAPIDTLILENINIKNMGNVDNLVSAVGINLNALNIKNVVIRNVYVEGINRIKAKPKEIGSDGLMVRNVSNATDSVHIYNNVIKKISSPDGYVDADGIYIHDLGFDSGAEYCKGVYVHDNVIENCKGRSIKCQVPAKIYSNTLICSSPDIDNFRFIDCQTGNNKIHNNDFFVKGVDANNFNSFVTLGGIDNPTQFDVVKDNEIYCQDNLDVSFVVCGYDLQRSNIVLKIENNVYHNKNCLISALVYVSLPSSSVYTDIEIKNNKLNCNSRILALSNNNIDPYYNSSENADKLSISIVDNINYYQNAAHTFNPNNALYIENLLIKGNSGFLNEYIRVNGLDVQKLPVGTSFKYAYGSDNTVGILGLPSGYDKICTINVESEFKVVVTKPDYSSFIMVNREQDPVTYSEFIGS